jgi:hypothetical protein
VKQLLTSGIVPEDIVLVTNDEVVYGPVLLATGWEYELPVRVLYDIPLGGGRFGSWVRLMLESIAGGFAFEPTLQFLAHSLSPGLDAKLLARSLQTLLPNRANRRSSGGSGGGSGPSRLAGRGYAVTDDRAAAGGDEGYTTPARSARPAGTGAAR